MLKESVQAEGVGYQTEMWKRAGNNRNEVNIKHIFLIFNH